MIRNFSYKTVISLMLWFAVPLALVACPSCTESTENTKIGESLSVSVVALSILPFVMVGSVSASIFYKWRKHQQESNEENCN